MRHRRREPYKRHEIHPAMATLAAERLPDATMHLIEGRGHLLVFADWDKVLPSLLR